jgi:hypothetical protein
MHGIDEGELEIEPLWLLRQFSTLLKVSSEQNQLLCMLDEQ